MAVPSTSQPVRREGSGAHGEPRTPPMSTRPAATPQTPKGGGKGELTGSRELRRCPPGLPPPGQRRGELSADADEKHRCLWCSERGSVRPPPQAVFCNTEGFAQQHPVTVQEQDRPVSALSNRFGASGRDNKSGFCGDSENRMLAVGENDEGAGKCPAEFLGRAGRSNRRGSELCAVTLGAAPRP